METSNFLIKVVVSKHYSDPTYEAWKLEGTKEVVATGGNSDPTYEAWKLINDSLLSSNERIPILPMRHGNYF